MDNPYAPPKSDILKPTIAEESAAEGPSTEDDENLIRREGTLLVTSKDVDFPPRCVICNAPTGEHRKHRVLRWHHSAFYLLVLANFVVYLIVASIVRKYGVVRYGVCQRHTKQRFIKIIAGWICVAVFLALLRLEFSMADETNRNALLAATAILGIGIVGTLFRAARPMSVRRIDRDHMWIEVEKRFLDSFPDTLRPKAKSIQLGPQLGP